MHHHLVACLHKPLTEADQPGGDAADVGTAAVVGEDYFHEMNALSLALTTAIARISLPKKDRAIYTQ